MKRTILFFSGLVVALVIAVIVSVHTGPAQANDVIFWSIRVPRVCMGLLVGGALAMAGAVFQAILRNPLADPYVLGTSSGASLGILVSSLIPFQFPGLLYGFAIAGAFGTVEAVHRIARVHGQTPVTTLALSGVVVSTFLNSVVFLIIMLSFRESFSTLFFLLGTLTVQDALLTGISSVLIALSGGWILASARSLNVLTQGDDTSRALGLHPERLRRRLFWAASVLVAASVALAGMIGFVGLIVPHALRTVIGPDHRKLLPASFLGGALMLVVLDIAARTVAAPLEIPVGIFAALSGTPFFIYLLHKKKGEVF